MRCSSLVLWVRWSSTRHLFSLFGSCSQVRLDGIQHGANRIRSHTDKQCKNSVKVSPGVGQFPQTPFCGRKSFQELFARNAGRIGTRLKPTFQSAQAD